MEESDLGLILNDWYVLRMVTLPLLELLISIELHIAYLKADEGCRLLPKSTKQTNAKSYFESKRL